MRSPQNMCQYQPYFITEITGYTTCRFTGEMIENFERLTESMQEFRYSFALDCYMSYESLRFLVDKINEETSNNLEIHKLKYKNNRLYDYRTDTEAIYVTDADKKKYRPRFNWSLQDNTVIWMVAHPASSSNTDMNWFVEVCSWESEENENS